MYNVAFKLKGKGKKTLDYSIDLMVYKKQDFPQPSIFKLLDLTDQQKNPDNPPERA